MTDEKYSRFGKYLILDHLVDGGMAKICRASYLGEQANKIVAIKMVQPRYSKNPSFVQMFEDELKVTFGLEHPNIAQVFDYGMVDEQLYSAMEYVDGANLKQYLDRLKQMKFVFPVEISTYIISQVSQALHYAHSFQDKLTGKSFNIIHRDISPHNIMLTYGGAVKVIDFGIAKADSNSEATQAGTIKGKLSYLAPEYLEGMELDHRYDQFAVGITLWEMLCSRKLFTAKNDLAVLKQIQACKVPKPSSINPNVPAELDEIVMKALSKDRTQRFENMDKLNRALVKFLYSNYPDFNATDLSYFAKQLFKNEIASDKKKFVEFGKIDIKPYLQELENDKQGSNNMTSDHPATDSTGSFVGKSQKTGKIEIDLGSFDEEEQSIPNLDLDFADGSTTAIGVKAKKKLSGGKTLQLKTNAGADKTGVSRKVGVKKSARPRKATAGSSQAKLKKGGTSVDKSGGGFLPTIIAVGVILFAVLNHEMILDKFSDKPIIVPETSGTETGKKPTKGPKPASVEMGRLMIYNLESDMTVFLNGEKAIFDGLTTDIEVGTEYSVAISRFGYKKWHYDQKILLVDGEDSARLTIPEMEKFAVGFLSSSQNFSPGSKIKFDIEGETFEKILPLKNERVPAGTYDATISNSLLGTERKVRFTVEENKRNFIK